MYRLLSYMSTLIVLSASSPAFAQGLLGKTMQIGYTQATCNKLAAQCSSNNSANTNVYFSPNGNIYDYGSGRDGYVYRNGVSYQSGGWTKTFSVHGNTFVDKGQRAGSTITVYYTMRNHSCSVPSHLLEIISNKYRFDIVE